MALVSDKLYAHTCKPYPMFAHTVHFAKLCSIACMHADRSHNATDMCELVCVCGRAVKVTFCENVYFSSISFVKSMCECGRSDAVDAVEGEETVA